MIRTERFTLALSLVLVFGLLGVTFAAAQQPPNTKTQKISSHLAQATQQGGEAAAFATELSYTTVTPNNTVLIDAIATADVNQLLTDLEALGLTNAATAGNLISGELPLTSVSALDSLASLQLAYMPRQITRAGNVTSQADEALYVAEARQLFNLDGTGVTVGILSDSYNCLGGETTDIASGDLPSAGVTVLREYDLCFNGVDEGRAMAQLVHDLAPGATLSFHTAFGGEAIFATGIDALRTAGADIIVDDVLNFSEAMFQDDIVAQAADRAAANNIPYFSAAGNDADRSIEQTFHSSGRVETPPGENFQVLLHDFEPGPAVVPFLEFTVPAFSQTAFILNWEDPSKSIGSVGADTDLDLFIYDMNQANTNLLASSTESNINGDPIEFTTLAANSTSSYRLVIGYFTGTTDINFKVIALNTSFRFDETRYPPTATLFGHANAAGVAGVGAVSYFSSPAFGVQPPVAAPLTALGGVPILFDTTGNRLTQPADRQQPRFASVDGTNTTFFGQSDQDDDGFPNFSGTSAAAPHAAAVAALMLECNPSLTPNQIYAAMADTAIDAITDEENLIGYDRYTGAGLIDATSALASLGCPINLDLLDVNNDDAITPDDAAQVANRLGDTGVSVHDINGDGTVTQRDLNLVIPYIGQTVN
jgi:hypothetical protein